MTRNRTAGVRLLSDLVAPAVLDRVDPDTEAITDGTRSLTWADHVDEVGRLAAVLVEIGVRPGDRVGVGLPKSCRSFASMHAVIRAGAVAVPIDPLAPPAHAASVLVDAGVGCVVTDRRLSTALADVPTVHSIVVPGVFDPAAPSSSSSSGSSSSSASSGSVRVVGDELISVVEPVEPVRVSPTDPAYVIYTSGSTGRPKGIVHSHDSGLAYATAAVEAYGLRGDDRFANIAPLHFDQSTFELYAAPLAGGSVVVLPDPVLRFPASVTERIERERVTVWYSVPFLLEQLLDRGALDDRDLTSLRWVLYGGESFPPARLAALMRRLPHATFSNVYGPAEVNQCTRHDVASPPVDDEPVPIGRAWPAAELRVVDPDDRTTEVVDGVLLVASDTMMIGYHGRPDLTDAVVTTDDDGVRWYDTGDLVRTAHDGTLVFAGRVDNQVKLRGHRIELEAIDGLLREHDLVDAATTVVERPTDGDDRLVALVVLATDDPSTVLAELRAHLADRLPRYAVPSEVVPVASLPRTTSGKVDRTAARSLLAEAAS